MGDQATASSALSQQEIDSLLAVHNRARAEVGVAPLGYSSSLAAYAQAWADHLASNGSVTFVCNYSPGGNTLNLAPY